MTENKFIRTVPPLSIGIITAFDIISLTLSIAAVAAVIKQPSPYAAGFLGIMAVDSIAAALATRRLMKNGVRFYEDRLEFTDLDDNAVFYYRDIENVQVYKDNAASLRKNYTQRYSSVILHLTDGSTVTAELGATTKRKLAQVEEEIRQRIK